MLSLTMALLVQVAPVADDVAETVETQQMASTPPGDGVADEQDEEQPTSSIIPVAEILVPKGHQILISVEAQVGSKISQPKQWFPIKLASPVIIDGVEVLPAGIKGEGQVVHAEKGGFAGSAGELILAARYLKLGDREIPLRSFKWIEEGDELLFRGADNTAGVIATNAVLGPLGFLIGGGNTTIEPGTVATAKFRADEIFEIDGESAGKPTQVE